MNLIDKTPLHIDSKGVHTKFQYYNIYTIDLNPPLDL